MSKFKLLFFALVSFLFIILFPKVSLAQECKYTTDDEFHSLRPYPAQPCTVTTANYAKYCGANITVQDTIEVEIKPNERNCDINRNGLGSCSFNVEIDKTLPINLGDASLPIMGNTEDVINIDNKEDTLNDAEKVNDYVSWYLGGIVNKKEYPSAANDTNLVNFSGPLVKLLPQEIAYAERISTVEEGLGKDVNKDGNQPERTNHDQIVVCGKETISDTLGLGRTMPADCAKKSDKYRLSDWSGDISFIRGVTGSIVNILDYLAKAVPLVPRTIIENSLLTEPWNLRVPPLSWDPQFKGDDLLYRKAYNEWRGKSCVIIPFPRMLVCIENILIPNKYADLFAYVPLSSTEDVKGGVKVDSMTAKSTSEDTKITNASFSNQTPANIYLAHIEEVNDSASLLQSTYLPRGLGGLGSPTNISPESTCKLIDSRSNKGDSLHATSITGTLHYNAEFTCTFDVNSQEYKDKKTCSKTVNITLGTQSSLPKNDDVWSRLVAGPVAIVKRMFPQLGTQLGTLKDIPASTKGAGGGDIDLKVPHIGGVSEYFLKGIQTLLRPKGYGEPISFGTVTGKGSGDIDCDRSAPDVGFKGLISREAAHALAVRWGGIEGDHVLECYNDAVAKSLAAGINPAFTILLWLHESIGSNPAISIQDFGINDNSIVGFTAQIERFLNLPNLYLANHGECFPGGKTNMTTFFQLYQSGHCTAGADKTYTQMMLDSWSWVTSCPHKPIWPTDMRCYDNE